MTIKPFGLVGHQDVGFFWSNKTHASLARTQLSGDFVPLLRQRLDLGLSVEDVVEMYYNAAITPWLNMAVDLQIVDSALNKDLNASGQLVNMGTACGGRPPHVPAVLVTARHARVFAEDVT